MQKQLWELREAERKQYADKAKAYITTSIDYELSTQREYAGFIADSLAKKAFAFILDIDEELERGSASALKIDQETTERTDITHITLRSLDRWAKQKYGISILEDHEQHASPENVQEQPAIQENEEDVGPNGGLSKTKANNLLTTFALLVEDIAKSAPKYRIKGEPNVSIIAEYIEELATNVDTGEKLSGVGNESIKSWIEAAIEAKKEKLDQK